MVGEKTVRSALWRRARPRESLEGKDRGPKNWKRPVGRPRQTWLRGVTTDLLPLNLGPNAAWILAQNRDRWRQDVETETLRRGASLWWWENGRPYG